MKSIKSCVAEIIDEEILSPLHPNETNDEFIERVCQLFLDEFEGRKGFAPMGFGPDVIDEIELEVTEVFKTKTYGHYNLAEYRKHHLKKRLA